MAKALGIVITIIASACVGIKKYLFLKERHDCLMQIKIFARQLEGKLRCMCMPLDECFNQSEGMFFVASQYIEKGLAPKEAVEKACAENEWLLPSDKDVIMHFAKGLGASYCDGQISNAVLLEENINIQIENAKSDLKTKGKLCVQGSILTASAVILLLI